MSHVLLLFLFSCTFEGSHDELSAHLETCSYEQLKGFLGRTDDHIQQLQDELKKKDEVIFYAILCVWEPWAHVDILLIRTYVYCSIYIARCLDT